MRPGGRINHEVTNTRDFRLVHAGLDRALAAVNPLVEPAFVVPPSPSLIGLVGVKVALRITIEHEHFWELIKAAALVVRHSNLLPATLTLRSGV